ncbi:MAG: hypothetical protein CEE38_07905 [Planctomycetes bacterium B3_Pla]|nr:MAG: hypothetical protein CEE38_07905 [Planctomycetes bacterium B3_Pla]
MRQEISENWFRHLSTYAALGTIKLYRRRLEKFGEFLTEQDRPLDREAIEEFLYGIRERGKSKRYVNVNLTAIKSYCKWRFRDDEEANPAKSVKMWPEDPPNQRVLSEEEYLATLAVAQGIDRDIIVFLANTGLRVTEFCSLKWEDIEADKRFLRVIGKGNKRRVVPLNPKCRDILEKYRGSNGDGRLPISRRSRHSVNRICEKLAKKAEIPKFGPHACRHFFATQLIRKGCSIYKVAKILGHRSVKITEQTYLHLVPMDLFGETDVL